VNDFMAENEEPLHIFYIDESAAGTQLARLAQVKARRSQAAVEQALDRLTRAAAGSENTMPPLLDAVRAYATVGEMCDALRAVWGEYLEIPVI
jgi:methylmalonyl-CoA mutase, N-terminal domain